MATVTLVLLLSAVISYTKQCQLDVTFPEVFLSGVPFYFKVQFPAFVNESEAIPLFLDLELLGKNAETVLLRKYNISTRDSDGTVAGDQNFGPINRTLDTGHHHLVLVAYDNETDEQVCDQFKKKVLVIPGWLTIFPPIVTAVVAIAFRQVLLALVMGIWLAAFLGQGYDPMTALLRTLDTYIVNSLVDHDHAAIIIATFFLSGLIGLVQRSGGGLGLAKIFSHFAKSHRRASLVCFFVALLIFFDDYTCVLITGNSLKVVIEKAGISKDKFAFIVQSMAPSVASFFPISSWVGAQIGYVQSGFSRCHDIGEVKPFNIVVESMPYRFLPLLMIFCVFLVCLLSRDFGCMLTVEKKQYNTVMLKQAAEAASNSDLDAEETDNERTKLLSGSADKSNEADALFEGSLAPKRNIPHRWFNAVVPFAIVIFVTFGGMIVDGYLAIRNNNSQAGSSKIKMTVSNVFGEGDAVAALIWANGLATVVLVVMLAIQRILSFKEVVECWIEGVKDIIEPLIILMLAWGLGNVISEIQTSSFIAQALNGGNVSARYIPVITVIIGFFMAYCTGSAFGTMGILFPLVIPTVCKLADSDDNSRIQTAAAILSSCIFGNLMSPIADLTVLTRAATRCDYNSHLKTCALYVLLTAFVSTLFGTLPVGAKWYPWWAGWIIMPLVLTVVFVVFSSGHSGSSRSLCFRGCPCIFHACNQMYFKLAVKLNAFKIRHLSRFKRRDQGFKPTIQPTQVEGEFKTADEHSGSSYYSSTA